MRIGILGGGQLGMMLAHAAARLGHTCRFLDPDPDACAQRAGELICAPFDDSAAIDRFTRGLDVATFEFENVPVATAEAVAARVPLAPSAASLRVTQDRLEEKRWFARSDFDTAPWARVESLDELRAAVTSIGLPAILKTRRGGYDGKGQARLRAVSDAEPAWNAIGRQSAISESMIRFDRELSLIGARASDGSIAWAPLVENSHAGGILRLTRAPAPHVDPTIEQAAHAHARALMESLHHVGVFTVELFQVGSCLLANETAPRVHNSGHWTIEGASTSQFENHIRAITGAPVVPMDAVGPCAMLNLIGAIPDAARAIRESGVTLHDYGKPPRAGRKVGHITIAGRSLADTDALVARLTADLGLAQNDAR